MLLENQNIACISQACLKKTTIIRIYSVDARVACQCCVLHNPRVCLGKANKLSNNLATSAPRVRADRAAAAERSLQQTLARPSDEPRIIAPWQEQRVILILRCVHRRPLLLLDVRRSEWTRRCAQTQQAHRSQREKENAPQPQIAD